VVVRTIPEGQPPAAAGPEQRLERGEVVFYPVCPFPLPAGDDHRFLLRQELGGAHKNISYDPTTARVRGFRPAGRGQGERLREVFAAFSRAATDWLARALPRYRSGWRPDQVSYRPEEEAGRDLRHKARNDLLHVDAFPNRPTHGARILRLFANLNPTEPRVWVTSDPFARLLERFGARVGLPGAAGWARRCGAATLALFRPGRPRRSAYDEFMLRFHDFLKANRQFQREAGRQTWSFPPGSAWLAMTDACSHAVLRGRYALEHSYFVPPHALALPDEAPAALLLRAEAGRVLKQAG
jgi:hypothetical protein